MITIWLDHYLTPSLNQSLRTHWAKRKREQISLENLVWYTFLEQSPDINVSTLGMCKRKVTIVSYRKSLLDHDNYAGGLKQLIDCLKHLHLICDDSPEYLELETIQEFSKTKRGTEIRIT